MSRRNHRIRDDFNAQGEGPVRVFADSMVSLNARPAIRMIDPKVDLAVVSDGIGRADWILPPPPPRRLCLPDKYCHPGIRDERHPSKMKAPVLLFDGECSLCNNTVQFVLSNECTEAFLFAPLQSQSARDLLSPLNIDAGDLSSVIVLQDGKIYRESEAVLMVLRQMKMPWRRLEIIRWIPAVVRNRVYRFIGRRRYAWWGKVDQEQCELLAQIDRKRFLDDA